MVIRPLAADDFDAVFEAFTAAFSDYVVPFSPTREQLAEMLRRRGWSPEASPAAFDGGRMVAFTLNGIEGDRGYDSGTGVVPTHRRRGLARELMLRSIELLRARGCKTYVLEVLDNNGKAVELYRSLGFVETRGLQSWRLERAGNEEFSEGRAHPEWMDVEPSWQNSTASIARAGERPTILGDADSYAILFPSNGDLAQLAVRPEARRKGLGTRLLHAAAAVAGKPLRIINVDERDHGIARFLETAGATWLVRQLEMALAI